MSKKSNYKNIVTRLLRKNISATQLIGYALASMLGLTIVIVAVKFYSDVRAASEEDTTIGRDYLIIQRSVEGLGSLFGESDTGFTEKDINELKSQPWVKKAGAFTSAEYNVSATIDMGGRSLSTALFFESIPDDYIDVKSSDWKFEPGKSKHVPIIISKDYLALYNFGFAASRGMPQLSENMMSLIPVKVSLSGKGKQEWVDARIVGFSSRLNTIAVPQEFMDWANRRFGEKSSLPSRLIVETTSPGDPRISQFLKEKDYELAGDKDALGRTSYFLKIITGVVSTIGLVISILSLGILLLSIWLLLYKNRSKTERLMLLGYSPSQICGRYYLLIAIVNGIVFVISIIAMLLISLVWKASLETMSLTTGSPWAAIITGVILIGMTTGISFIAVRRSVIKCFRPAK
ncbi:MAG: ABC transporter permease [Paramuribaculum sp.]|nr:ABC transporter permease [Paramuribaculum sp.]